jgi:hypothetical protein
MFKTLKFRNGSILDVVGATETTRGGRRQGGLLDELRDADETSICEVVLPLLNISRHLPDDTVNPNEPNQQVISATSAGSKLSYAYDKLIDAFEMSIIDPNNYFVFGCDYRVPMLHGLLPSDYVTRLKTSPSYNEESFAREYLSMWSGANTGSWFDFDKLQSYRKNKNPETHANFRTGSNSFYLLSVDVGRFNDQTVVCVFRVNILGSGKYVSTLVNIFVLGKDVYSKPFSIQAMDLKRIIKDFQPQEVVIDTNGLGVGIADEMIRTQVGPRGETYPAYGFTNDDNYKKIQPRDAICILYGIKANGPLNSKIHSNAYARISSGSVHFLIKEQEARVMLLSTKVGQKMTFEDRVARLLPHEMTTSLFHEMANLRLKPGTASGDLALEQINARYPKDKYSAFAYGQWRIKELEEASDKKNRHGRKSRILTFFTEGGTK